MIMEYQDYEERHLNKKKSDSQKKEREKEKNRPNSYSSPTRKIKGTYPGSFKILLCLCHDHKITVKEWHKWV